MFPRSPPLTALKNVQERHPRLEKLKRQEAQARVCRGVPPGGLAENVLGGLKLICPSTASQRFPVLMGALIQLPLRGIIVSPTIPEPPIRITQ